MARMDISRNFSRFIPRNLVQALPEEFLASGLFSPDGMRQFLENEFWWNLTAGHLALKGLFPPFPELLEQPHCSLFGIPLSAVLGRGSDSAVYRTEDGRALKVVASDRTEKLQREYHLLNELANRNLVRVYDFFQNSGGAAFLMEEVKPQLSTVQDYRNGLCTIHAKGFLHGDIRRGNLGRNRFGCGVLFDLGNAVPWTEQKAEAELKRLSLLFEESSMKTIRMKAEMVCG